MLGREVVDLLLQLALAVAGGRGDAAVHGDVPGRRPDEGGQLRPPHVAERVHHEEAVLGRGEARAELGVGSRDAVDVRDAELLVADDDRAGMERERLHALRLAQVDEEARILVEGANVGILQVGGNVEQTGVQRLLVARVRGKALAGLRPQEVRHVVGPVLTGRHDVEDLAATAVHERRANRRCLDEAARERAAVGRREETRRQQHRRQGRARLHERGPL